MRLSNFIIPVIAVGASTPPDLQSQADPPPLPFSFQYLFTTTIYATEPIGGVPLPLGGVQYASSVTGGYVLLNTLNKLTKAATFMDHSAMAQSRAAELTCGTTMTIPTATPESSRLGNLAMGQSSMCRKTAFQRRQHT